MNDNKFTRLTLDQSDLHVEWEVPYEDVGGEDMMQAIRTLMIGMTFNDITIERSMASYLQEHFDNYEVYEKDAEEIEEVQDEKYDNGNNEISKPHYDA